MATAFATIEAAPTTSPSVTSDAANDNGGCWTTDPRTVRLLGSCAANPPKGEWIKERFGWSGAEWFAYTGYRAEALEAIRSEYGERAHRAYMAHGEPAYDQFNAWCRSPSVRDAIDAALPMEA
ncbi:MAG TPA: hypothetical protein VF592_05795 [Sphingomonas sp.]|jgi:hypothetical protein|uniref:hypothetical protein n=1 Tax=Sphingomonas sp. TaxID=28214 RepID=UPI002ED98A47